MTELDLREIPELPVDDDGPVFNTPWQAQAFALVVKLQEQGVFTWPEWADHLGEKIAAAHADGDPDLGDTYYQHWLAALESIVQAKGLATSGLLAERKQAAFDEHQRLHGGDHHHHGEDHEHQH